MKVYQSLYKRRIFRIFNGMAPGNPESQHNYYNTKLSHTPKLFQSLISPSTAFLPVK